MFRLRVEQMIPVFAECDDRDAMGRQAHDLVSLAGNLGCTELMDLARGLSGALKQNDPEIQPLTATIVSAANRALIAIEERFAA